MENYGPTICHHCGKKNVIANTFTNLPHCDVLSIPVGENAPINLLNFNSKGLDISNNPDLLECFLDLPLPNNAENYPADLKWIITLQKMSLSL